MTTPKDDLENLDDRICTWSKQSAYAEYEKLKIDRSLSALIDDLIADREKMKAALKEAETACKNAWHLTYLHDVGQGGNATRYNRLIAESLENIRKILDPTTPTEKEGE